MDGWMDLLNGVKDGEMGQQKKKHEAWKLPDPQVLLKVVQV